MARRQPARCAICVRPTAPAPMSLPASMSLGLAMASITSKMREVFSWIIGARHIQPVEHDGHGEQERIR